VQVVPGVREGFDLDIVNVCIDVMSRLGHIVLCLAIGLAANSPTN